MRSNRKLAELAPYMSVGVIVLSLILALMALMQQQNGAQLQRAMEQDDGASTAEMASLLKTVLSSGEGRALLQRLSRQLQQP